MFRGGDMFKVWNTALVAGDPCKHIIPARRAGLLFVYDPPDGQPLPPYRFLPNATMPDRLVTNQFGWRGAPMSFRAARAPSASSSSAPRPWSSGHHMPHSFPEFVGHWLERWAKATQA